MQLQVDNEFQQVKIKDLNDKYNIEKFSTGVSEGKVIVAEQKIREPKSRVAKLSLPITIILQSEENVNNVESKTYGITPNESEQKLLSSEKFKTLFNFHRMEQSKNSDRLDRYDQKRYAAKK